MEVRRFLGGILAIALLVTAGVGIESSAAESLEPLDVWEIYLPLVMKNNQTADQGAIVVDHRHTDASQIPDYWIQQAKGFVVHYAHTSHGGQVLSGLSWLEQRDSKYNVDIEVNGSVVLPDDVTALRIYDGNNYSGNTYITPDMYWESVSGIEHTRSVANTAWFNFSTWTWCGQMSDYSVVQVQTYLDTLAGFESDYQPMRFIYYTGHTDGTTPESGEELWRNNNMVRQYVQANSKVLFDFADIESYDPDGNFYPAVTDYCEWCPGWCTAHPDNLECQSLPSCAHSRGLQCTLKGQAFWWLMARLAGWDGTPAP